MAQILHLLRSAAIACILERFHQVVSTGESGSFKPWTKNNKQNEQSVEYPKHPPKQEDVWSQAQQQQLETALTRFPMGMDKNERWASISAAVPGKSKKQCVERFKFVKTQLLAKKKAEKKAAEAAAANGGAEAAAAKK